VNWFSKSQTVTEVQFVCCLSASACVLTVRQTFRKWWH